VNEFVIPKFLSHLMLPTAPMVLGFVVSAVLGPAHDLPHLGSGCPARGRANGYSLSSNDLSNEDVPDLRIRRATSIFAT
jgi:hypothetical protein